MNRIKVLSEEVSNRIAAGEVIERPASVVRELVENAIDAEADTIIITVQNGGKDLIRITDNGIGMSPDDALMAFERHGTSKIRNVEDIFSIATLGFRGEALPSIASVSNTTLITREAESETATKVEFHGGQLGGVSQCAANSGTTISVERLFYLVPARRKFLKSEQVELKHIINYLHYQAVLFPHVTFRLVVDGKERLNFPKVEDLSQRLIAVFGKSFTEQEWIPLHTEQSQLQLHGYLGGLAENRENFMDYHYLFINGRFVSDKILLHSIRTAYEPFVKKTRIFQQGNLPPYILFLTIAPELIDFNVHPAKIEVRFRDTQLVYGFMKNTLTNALLQYDENRFKALYPSLQSPVREQGDILTPQSPPEERTYTPRFSSYQKPFSELYQPTLFTPTPVVPPSTQPVTEPNVQQHSEQEMLFFLPAEEDLVNPWQLHQSYIFIQVEDGLMIIDQHAAHERILYEKIIHRLHGVAVETQKLIFPIVVDIPPYISSLVMEQIQANMDALYQVGFSITSFSGNSIVINEIPVEIEDWEGGDLFIEILKQFEAEYGENEDFRESIAKSVACKAAIKAGKRLGRKEMLSLINDLFACQVPYYCPHGRPLMIRMSNTELEKKFKRIL